MEKFDIYYLYKQCLTTINNNKANMELRLLLLYVIWSAYFCKDSHFPLPPPVTAEERIIYIVKSFPAVYIF